MSVPHPIPYQGSKRQIADIIVNYFPPNAERLIEPFAGSAAVALYAASQKKIQKMILNDINQPLMALWEMIIQQPRKLADQYETLWNMQQGRERRFYDLVRARFNRTHHPYYLLYLLARCVKASVRYNARGEFNQSPDNRRKGRNPKTMRQDIEHASVLLREVDLVSEDYRKILAKATSSDILYLDPPYQGVSEHRDPRYLQSVTFEGLTDALIDLNERDIPYILSYDGKTGAKQHGEPLPTSLELTHIEIDAGRSSQATLLGLKINTYESLYISPALGSRLRDSATVLQPQQLALF